MKIVSCPKCSSKNRISSYSDGQRPICGRCGTRLLQSEQTESINTALQNTRLGNFLPLAIIVLIVAIALGILITPNLMRKDFSLLIAAEAQKTENLKSQYEDKLATDAANLEKELAIIDTQNLRKKATQHYEELLEFRKSFEKKFALSAREKTQLQMLNLSSDSTKSIHNVIRSVAKEASPIGADISVDESASGIALHINFDMSSMTSGEHGTRTKHVTIDSLRKEVISLISRVTNDVFQFSKGLNVSSIYVGCRHHVSVSRSEGSTAAENLILYVENRILYKVKIQENQVSQLTNNPFLDIYSTTKYFKVEEDNFNTVTITTSQL